MPNLSPRQQVIRRNISGGTSAPRGAARGPHVGQQQQRGGVGPGRPVTGPFSGNIGSKVGGMIARPQTATPAGPTMPWDVQASNDEAAALKRRGSTIAGLDAGWMRQQQAAGLEGPWADARTNPFSEAALLQRSYDNAQRGVTNSFASQGQLYAGSALNARNANTHQFDLQRDQLQKAYAEQFAQYQAGRVGAMDDFTAAQQQANWDRVNAGLSEEPDPTAAPMGKPKANRKKQIRQNISKGRKAR